MTRHPAFPPDSRSAARRRFAAGVLAACCCGLLLLQPALRPGPAYAEESTAAETPPPGSAERKAILDVLRAEVKDLHQLDVVFVVTHLKVQHDWAFLHTFPRSRDGANRYEDLSALMHKRGGKWQVMELSAGDVQDLKRAHPAAPPAIFSGF